MAKKDEKMLSLTTRVAPRDFLAVKILAGRNGITESAYLRSIISNDVTIATTEVPEEELIRLKSATLHHRKTLTLWQRFRQHLRK